MVKNTLSVEVDGIYIYMMWYMMFFCKWKDNLCELSSWLTFVSGTEVHCSLRFSPVDGALTSCQHESEIEWLVIGMWAWTCWYFCHFLTTVFCCSSRHSDPHFPRVFWLHGTAQPCSVPKLKTFQTLSVVTLAKISLVLLFPNCFCVWCSRSSQWPRMSYSSMYYFFSNYYMYTIDLESLDIVYF